MHKSRNNRKANEKRRQEAKTAQKPLPLVEQQERAEHNRNIKRRRYPSPPAYPQPKFGAKGKI